MAVDERTIAPAYSAAEAEELRRLDDFQKRLAELLERGAITESSPGSALADDHHRREEIEWSGRFRAATARARELRNPRPAEALEWAEAALRIDDSTFDAWELAIDLNWAREDEERAIALCVEAEARFPQVKAKHEQLLVQRVRRQEARRAAAEKLQRDREFSELIADARGAVARGRDDEALALCERALAARPGNADVLLIAAFAHQRLGELDEAIRIFEGLTASPQSSAVWRQALADLKARRKAERLVGPAIKKIEANEVVFIDANDMKSFLPPRFSWAGFTGELMREHWQKLVLCLAVVLIVASSTVGAHLLLGQLLWSPIGVCMTALVWALMFAALGTGLVVWGAERAGRAMLALTSIVVPIHFLLVGEMKLLVSPRAIDLAVGALDVAALSAMTWLVAGMLASRARARFLSVALLLMSVGGAAAAPKSPVPFGWSFAAFQAPMAVFLGAVWSSSARRRGETERERRALATLALAVLGPATLIGIIGIGGRALELPAALYAAPLMLGAVAVARIAAQPIWFQPGSSQAALARLGGLALSGLAFALALAPARPPSWAAVASANLVAVGSIGFLLYLTLLRRHRQPAFLYLAAGALAATFPGVEYFAGDSFRAAIDAVRAALGFRRPPSRAFLSLLGLLVNPLLVWLSFRFRDGWRDARLARHCHYIGLPLALAACAFSMADPRAATICLAAYSILFGLASWRFAAPWLAVPTIAAIVGSAYFGSTLVPGATLAHQALIAIVLAWSFRGVERSLRWSRADDAHARPWKIAARGLAAGAVGAATWFLAVDGPCSIAAASTFALSGLFHFVLNRERPGASPVALALISFVELTLCVLSLATGGRPLISAQYGLLFVGDALALLAAMEAARFGPRRSSGPSPSSEHFLRAMPAFAIGLTLIADGLAAQDLGASRLTGTVWLLGALSFLVVARSVPRSFLVYLGLAQSVAGTMDLAFWIEGRAHPGLGTGWLAIVAAADALALALVAALGRRWPWSRPDFGPCTNVAGVLTTAALALALGARAQTRDAWPLGTTALVVSAVVTVVLSWARREAGLIYAMVVYLVAATGLVLLSLERNDPAMAYVLGLAAAIEAVVFWWAGFGCERLRNDWARSCARPFYQSTAVLALLGAGLADGAASAWLTVALAFLLTVKSLHRAEWLYPVMFALGAACYCRWLGHASTVALIASAMACAFVLWTIAEWAQSRKSRIRDRLGLAPLDHEIPIFHGALAAGAIALGLRAELGRFESVPGLACPWLPLSWSALSVLMLRLRADRGWIHLGLAFLCWGVFAAFGRAIEPGPALLPIGLALALGLLALERLVRPREPMLLNVLGVAFRPGVSLIAPVVRIWGLAVGCLASVLTIVIIGAETAANLLAVPSPIDLSTTPWWAVLGALGLAVAFVAIEESRRDGRLARAPEWAWIAFHAFGVLALWWMGARSAPWRAFAPAPAVYFPIATAFSALAANGLGRWRVGGGARAREGEQPGDDGPLAERTARALATLASALSLLALLFTGGAPTVSTLAVLTMAAVSFGLSAGPLGLGLATGLGALAWTAAGALAGFLAAPWWAVLEIARGPLESASGAVAAACSLFWLTGREGTLAALLLGPGRNIDKPEPRGPRNVQLVRPIECVAWAASLLAALVAFAFGTAASVPEALLGAGVLLASCAPQILIAVRWRVEWPVYLAHAALVLAYFHLRRTFPTATAADGAVLTLMGYLDLALFEALERLQGPEPLARPTRHASLIVPLLPLLQLLEAASWDDVSLFYFVAAATFYAVACARLRWKAPGYAAAVFCNAVLWTFWGRNGWVLADHPELYLVPVGLSTILFAEVNRELGRSTINSIRTVGLIIVYAALAAPVWSFDSFGAWLVLLIASLAGVFLGIGLRLQTFLWLGLTTFALVMGYEMMRLSADYAFAKWAIMLALGIGLVLFVAFNEKKRILGTMLDYYGKARLWD